MAMKLTLFQKQSGLTEATPFEVLPKGEVLSISLKNKIISDMSKQSQNVIETRGLKEDVDLPERGILVNVT